MFDLTQARQFIELLHGDADKNVCWQVFHDSKVTQDTLNKSEVFHAPVDACVDYFNGVQAHNYGVYVTLNKTDGKGREEQNIVGYSILFADFDNLSLPNFPIEPHFITQRDATHSHCYWRVNGIVTDEQFKKYQKQIAMYLGSDEQVFDTTRVVRVAGSCNMKNPAHPAMYNIVKVGDHDPFTTMDIDEAFPLTGEKLAKLTQWIDNSHALETGEGFNDDPINRQKMISWLGRAEPAIQGNGTYTLVKVASMGLDLGIPLEECQQLMWEHYDHRCIPTWRETGEQREFNACIKRAYKYANNAVGCRTTVGVFSALRAVEPLDEPTGGWEENAKLKNVKKDAVPLIEWNNEAVAEKPADGIVMDEAQAAVMMLTITNKSTIVEMAQVFLAIKYPNAGLIRCDKIFYAFNGKSWGEVPDDAIIADIAWHFLQLQLPPSKIKNIFDWVCHLTYQKNLSNNTWLTGAYDNEHTLVFDNTLVEMKDDIKLIPHTRDFFCVNELGYEYKKGTGCPEWRKFLDTIWDDNNLKMMLQEFFGYCLTTDSSLQKIGLFIGKSRAGKSVISDVLSNMIGQHNVVSPPLETIIDNSVKHAISQSKLVLIPEATTVHQTKQSAVLGMAKTLSGGDSFSFHQLYKGSATARFAGKMAMVANSMPDFVDTSGALANRFLVFHFTRSFIGREDTGLTKRLLAEISGILEWAMEGLVRLQKNGKFTTVEESVEMLDEMKRDMFPLADFVDDYCDVVNDVETLSSDLHKAYLHWAAIKEVKSPMTNIRFSKYLKSSYLPVSPKRLATGRGFIGIRVKPIMVEKVNLRGGEVVAFKPVPKPMTG